MHMSSMDTQIHHANLRSNNMYIVTRVHTRPNLEVEFFHPKEATTPEFKNYFIETYIGTGKSILIEHSVSEDGLAMTSTSIWDNEASFTQFSNDPNANELITTATAYNTANGIIETITVETV